MNPPIEAAPARPPRSRKGLIPTMMGIWLALLVVGFGLVIDYENRAGPPVEPPLGWPAGSALAADLQRPTLVLVAHPRCPCTRASIGELNRLMARAGDLLTAEVIFFAPEGVDDDWAATDQLESARAIPGVSVTVDSGGEEARRFGASTSGHALLYGTGGELLFSGGITGSRGHSGDNAGRSAIVNLVRGEATERADTPVFGCNIFYEECEL